MPISQVEIKSFKSIVDQTIDLGQLNVFIGTNGSGKSNFLEAIGILSCAIDGHVSYAKLADRGVRLSAPEVFKASFRNLSRKKTFSLKTRFNGLEYHASISPDAKSDFNFAAEKIENTEGHIAGRSNAGVKISSALGEQSLPHLTRLQSIIPSAEALNGFSEQELAHIQDVKKYAIYSLSTPILRGVSPDGSNKEPLGLYGGGLSTALQEVIIDYHRAQKNQPHDLKRFFRLLDWFEQISTTDEVSSKLQSNHLHTGARVVKYTDKYMKTNFNNLYAYDVSEGALYILFVLILLLHKKSPNIFALDNVDNALNPGLVRDLMRNVADILSKTPHKQMLMTTHNPTTLDAVDLFNNDHRLFVVARNSDGHTEITRVMPPQGFTREQWVAKYQGMRLSEIWLSGIIGGLPRGF